MVVSAGLSRLPPITKGEIICVVETPVVTTSAITPLPGAGSSPTLLETSFNLDVLSVYSRNHPAVDSPTFINAYALNPVMSVLPIPLIAIDVVNPITVVLDCKEPPDDVTVTTPAETGETSIPVPKLTVPAVPTKDPSSSTSIPVPAATTPVNAEPSIAGSAPVS